MSVSMQRKLAFGILGLALTALVVDKAVFGPSGASAAPTAPAAAAAPEPAPRRVVLGSPAAKASAAKLENRLKVATGGVKWSADEVVASLRKSPSWATGEGAHEAAAADGPASFREKHELKAIMTAKGAGDATRIALIGGRSLQPGQELDGYTLVSVGARSAVFEAGAHRVVLTLNGLPESDAR
jgi:hypothetical protein